MKMTTALFAAAAIILPATAFAQTPPRSQNLEPACNASGSGMDPRCVGDTTAGTVTDMTTSREQKTLQNGAPPATVAVPSDREVIIDRR